MLRTFQSGSLQLRSHQLKAPPLAMQSLHQSKSLFQQEHVSHVGSARRRRVRPSMTNPTLAKSIGRTQLVIAGIAIMEIGQDAGSTTFRSMVMLYFHARTTIVLVPATTTKTAPKCQTRSLVIFLLTKKVLMNAGFAADS